MLKVSIPISYWFFRAILLPKISKHIEWCLWLALPMRARKRVYICRIALFHNLRYVMCIYSIRCVPLVFVQWLESLQLPLMDNERCGKTKAEYFNRRTYTLNSCILYGMMMMMMRHCTRTILYRSKEPQIKSLQNW